MTKKTLIYIFLLWQRYCFSLAEENNQTLVVVYFQGTWKPHVDFVETLIFEKKSSCTSSGTVRFVPRVRSRTILSAVKSDSLPVMVTSNVSFSRRGFANWRK